MNLCLQNLALPGFLVYGVILANLISPASAAAVDEASTLKALDSAKAAFIKKNYDRMWEEVDKISSWLEANAPRSGLSWNHAEEMIKSWVKKSWYEDVLEVKPLSEGGMEATIQRHQGSFHGWTWDTGQKTVTTDFVFEAAVKAVNRKGKILKHRIRFHFDKGPSGWSIKRGGVM